MPSRTVQFGPPALQLQSSSSPFFTWQVRDYWYIVSVGVEVEFCRLIYVKDLSRNRFNLPIRRQDGRAVKACDSSFWLARETGFNSHGRMPAWVQVPLLSFFFIILKKKTFTKQAVNNYIIPSQHLDHPSIHPETRQHAGQLYSLLVPAVPVPRPPHHILPVQQCQYHQRRIRQNHPKQK